MKVLGLDFETTGLDSTSCRVIEIGAVVWETDEKKPLAIMSELVRPDGFETVPAEIVKITGITDEMIGQYAIPGKDGFVRLLKLMEGVDCVIAHNASFDRGFFEAEVLRYGLPFDVNKIRWVDTMIDVPYPEEIQTRKLTYLAAEHGVLNNFAHRAVFDVLVMLRVLENYEIANVIERSNSPTMQVIAKVSFEEKDKAKGLGFRWNSKDKIWYKEFKEVDIPKRQFPFEYEVQPV